MFQMVMNYYKNKYISALFALLFYKYKYINPIKRKLNKKLLWAKLGANFREVCLNELGDRGAFNINWLFNLGLYV